MTTIAGMQITPNLLSWQLAGYSRAHGSRANLIIHIVTAPLFVAGIVATPFVPFVGLPVVLLAFLAQALGHKREHNPPEPFRSPLDVIARIFVEQFVTFPRFVLSGGFARAWREAR